MEFSEFEHLLSPHRIAKYSRACDGDEPTTMVLYRANIRLAYELFSVASVFEVVLRNKIDDHYKAQFLHSSGSREWLRTQSEPGGCFYDNPRVATTYKNLKEAKAKLLRRNLYTHNKLVAELTFGFWRHLFASKEFSAAGSTLHRIFINRPHGTSHTDIYNKLTEINNLRNRIAHHEPICFNAVGRICTVYAVEHYETIMELLKWLDIAADELLFEIDNVQREVSFIESLYS